MANQPANGHATAIPLKRFFERVAGYDALDAGRALAGRQAERARYTTNLVVGDVDLLDHGGQSNWEGEQLFGGELFLLYRAKNKIVGRSCYFTGGSARGARTWICPTGGRHRSMPSQHCPPAKCPTAQSPDSSTILCTFIGCPKTPRLAQTITPDCNFPSLIRFAR